MTSRNGLICLALTLITLGVYAPALQNDFTNYDDTTYVTLNPHVQSGLKPADIAWAFTSGYGSNWHPLTWISHMLDCQLYGLKPWGHHLTNVLLHTADTLLLFGVLFRLTGARWRSALVAAFFAWHPVHVESVAWVAERKDVLSAFFWLLTMWAYLSYVEKPGPRRYALTLLLFALGLMSKPMVVTLPCVLLLLDYWPLNRIAEFPTETPESKNAARLQIKPVSWKQSLIEKTPFFFLVGISSLLTFFVQREAGSVWAASGLPVSLRISTALISYCRYLTRLFWPQHLSVFYPHPAGWPSWMVLGAFLFLAMVTLNAFRRRRTHPYMIVGWLWFIGTLVPVIGLVQVGAQSMADRYTYIPWIGLLIMVMWDVDDLTRDWKRRKPVLVPASGVALGACLVLTWNQVNTWRNSGTLFRQALKSTSGNYIAHTGLGMYLSDHDRPAEAIEQYKAALQISPGYFVPLYGLGCCLAAQEKWEAAADRLAEAIRIYTQSAEAHEKLGLALLHLGRNDEALAQYVLAVQLNPSLPEAHLDLANMLVPLGRINEALSHYSAAIRLKPDWPAALNDLAWVRATHPDPDVRNGREALSLALHACELDRGKDARYLGTLDAAYAESGQFAEALATAQKACDLARSRKQNDVVQAAEERIKFYESGQPYHQHL